MTPPSDVALNQKRFPCPYTGCRTILRSSVSFEVHCKYFHKPGAKNDSIQPPVKESGKAAHANVNLSATVKQQEFCAKPYCCDEPKCVDKNGNKKSFKSYVILRQHYLNVHAKKVFSCGKCDRLFSEESKRARHWMDCSVKFVCTCGISYSGKKGLLSHIKRSDHEIPNALKEYFAKKHRKKPPKATAIKPEKKAIVSTLPRGVFSTPALTFQKKGAVPILPKGLLENSVVTAPCSSISVMPSNQSLPLSQLHKKKLLKPARNCLRSRFVIDVIRPIAAKTPTNTSAKPAESSTTRTFEAVSSTSKRGSNLDSLSAAMITSGIVTSNEQSPEPQQPNQVEYIQSKTSQTDWSTGNQTAQDFSCQTDEFLAWLDSESAQCSSDQCRNENLSSSHTQTSIQQFDNPVGSDIDTGFGHIRTVAQNETQTDSDWLSAILHETECLTNEVSNAESQTNFAMYGNHGASYNSNMNNNHNYGNLIPDSACDIQTQTAFMDSMTDGTTQTMGFHHSSSSNENTSSPLFLNFVNDIQTQTDTSESAVDTGTVYTQTAWQCNDFTEFFNMETQTENFIANDLELNIGHTQTLLKF